MREWIVAVAAAVSLFGQDTQESDFLSTLEEITEQVDEQKINADYTPSTVTVLRKRELIELGIQNLHEALTLIPGVESNINNVGWKEVTIRGVRNSNTYGFDKVKLLIDGVSVTSQLYGSVYYYLDFPVDLIERIEVVRGPASALYGSGAYTGAINVVTKLSTKKKSSSLYAYSDSYTHKALGGTSGTAEMDGLKLAVDGYFQKSDKTIDTHKNKFSDDRNGKSFERLEDYSVGILAEYGAFSWTTRLKRSDSGNFYGSDEFAESKDDHGQINRFLFSELTFAPELDMPAKLEFKAGYNEYDFDLSSRSFPIIYTSNLLIGYLEDEGVDAATAEGIAAANITKDAIVGYASKEKSSYGIASVTLPVANHELKAEYLVKETKNISNSYKQNYLISMIEDDLADFSVDENWAQVVSYDKGFIGTNLDRKLSAVTLSDLVRFQKLDLSLAVRQDDYNHFDPVTSSNFGLVYHLSPMSNLKLAYGSAFRVPSWIEYNSQPLVMKVGNKDIKPEKIETVEFFLTYIPSPDHRFRIGQFYSTMTDVIDSTVDPLDVDNSFYPELIALQGNDNNNTYVNYSKRESYGIEMEYNGKFDVKNRLALSFSYVRTVTKGIQPFYNTREMTDAVNVAIPDTAQILANAAYIYAFTPSLSLASHLYYTGPKVQNAQKNVIDGFANVTETLNYNITSDWLVSFAVKNALNQSNFVPSSWAYHPDGLPREERYYTLRVSAKF